MAERQLEDCYQLVAVERVKDDREEQSMLPIEKQ